MQHNQKSKGDFEVFLTPLIILIQLKKILKEVINKHPFCVVIVDYEKTFDSVSSLAVMDALDNAYIILGSVYLFGSIYEETQPN